MDTNKQDYSGRTKEAGTNDKLAVNTSKVSAKYVFKPEVVKSLPKYTQHCSADGKNSRKNSGNGLRGLFDRVTRHSSENKSQERDIAERKRSRSLFLAHDHSKDSAKLTDDRSGRLDRRNARNQPDVRSRKDSIDARLKNSVEHERGNEQPSHLSDNKSSGNLSKHRGWTDQSVERHGTSSDHLETCQEEYRENGKLCCSSTGTKRPDDHRYNNPTRSNEKKWSQQDSAIEEDHRRSNRNHGEVVDRECCEAPPPLPRHRTNHSFSRENHAPKADSYRQHSREVKPTQSSDSCERHKRENVRSLRRVDSPYPYTSNHADRLSPPRDVTGVDQTSSKLTTCRSNQDDATISPIFRDYETTVKTPGDCAYCRKLGSTIISQAAINHNYSIVDGVDGTKSDREKAKARRIYEFEKKFEHPDASRAAGVLYRTRSLPQLSIHDSGVGSGHENLPGRPTSRLVADLRQLLTLKQHYYPEGGWGWVIVVVGVLVQILSHGIHGSVGVLVQQVQIRFESLVYLQSG